MFDSSRRGKAAAIPTAAEALPDRAQAMAVPDRHFVLDAPLQPPFAQTTEEAVFGLGCFWGAERIFWQLPGVVSTAAGYAGGHTANPTYRDVCSGQTGHTEVVWVAFDPTVISYTQLLKVFFEAHDPTQGMRQGNDRGTQYRSAIYTSNPQQLRLAQDAARAYGAALQAAGRPGPVTTEIAPLQRWFFAEEYHQQYLAKNPDGYCGIGGTGVSCPIAPATAE